MKTLKKLFVLISVGGDGSFYPVYTFNEDWIKEQEELDALGELEWERDYGVDGDGFHYDVLMVPVECTAESLGIRLIEIGD